MPRERKNAPAGQARPRTRTGGPSVDGIRRRAVLAVAEIELDAEDLRALADAGVDPEEVQEIARAPREEVDVSIFDRTSPREDLEGLMAAEEPQG